jgi:CRP-like cAMP-binding protein
MSSFSLVTYLATLAYFRGLPPDTLERIATRAVRHTYPAGTVLFLEGDPASGIWVIEQGRVKVYKISPDGYEHVLIFLGDHDTFNEIGAFEGNNPANAATLSEAVLWVIPSDVITELCHNNSRFALGLIRFLARRVQMLVGQIEALALYSVTVRLARFLLKQNEEPSLSGPGITRTTIAAHLATTPQSISIALRDLETTGAIQFDRHHIVIVQPELLRSIAML